MNKTAIITLIAAIAVGGAIYLKQHNKQATSKSRRASNDISVVVSPATQTQWQSRVEALGTVKANESVQLSAKLTEKVTDIHFDDGEVVTAGQLLVTLHHAEQKAKLAAAKANLIEQQREYRRIEGLVKTQTIASNELDKIRTAIDVAAAGVAQSEAELAARFIHSPFSGVLGFRQISPGALLSPGAPITSLDDLSVVKLDFPIPERYLNQLRPGTMVTVQAAAFERSFNGQVTTIDSRVDPTTRSVVVRAELANPDLSLRPGMLMTLQLVMTERPSLVIPEEALIPRQDRQYVFVVEQGTVVEKQIEVGGRQQGWVEVASGLLANEQVITRGAQRVRPGQSVTTSEKERFSYQEVVQ